MSSDPQPARRRDLRTFTLLDFYRFVSAVGIALAHYTVYFPVSPYFRHYIFERGESLMGFFFTLSGFVIMYIYDGRITSFAKYGNYLKKRLIRIYPLFLATFAISYFYILYAKNHSDMLTASAILPNLLLIHAWNTTHMLTFDYPSWSVSAEMFVYLLFPVFLFLIDRLGAFAIVLPFVVGLAVIVAFSAFRLGNWESATFNGGCLRAAPSFVAGMVVYRLATRNFVGLRAPVWLAHGMAVATLVLALAGAPGLVVLVYLAALVFVMAVAEPERAGVLSQPFARTLANASYGFYLLHVLVGSLVLRQVVNYLRLPATATYALAPVAIGVTTVASIVSFQYFESPLRRYLGSPIRRTPAPLNFSGGVKQTISDGP